MTQPLTSPYAPAAANDAAGKVTLADSVYERMRWDIVRGALAPGMPLRLEQLKARYGAGFSPLREALNRLQGERLVQSLSLRGFIVAPLSPEEMEDAIDSRVVIETEALRRAIRRGDDAWESEILAAAHQLSRQTGRIAADASGGDLDQALIELESRHRRFHRALIAACGSPRLLQMADTLYMETERYRVTALTRAVTKGERNADAEHKALVDTVLARDAEAAVALLEQHFRDTGRQVAGLV
ncbi:MAG: FCD domain-containing protein [Alphaproteobacteria bacterium]